MKPSEGLWLVEQVRRRRSSRSTADLLNWGYWNAETALRVEPIGGAIAKPDLYEPLPDFPGLARTRAITILPLGSVLAGEKVLLRLEWDMAPGNYTQLELLRAPLPGRRSVYVSRRTMEVQILAATESEPDDSADLRFLRALFATNGEAFRYELFGGLPTEVVVFMEIDKLFLIDLFWAALDAVPDGWGDPFDEAHGVLSKGWVADDPPLHECLLTEESPLTDLMKLKILDQLLPAGPMKYPL